VSRELNYRERLAVAALQRLARRWPPSLKLFSWSGSLVIFDSDDDLSDANRGVLATIVGIPNDGGDP